MYITLSIKQAYIVGSSQRIGISQKVGTVKTHHKR